MFSLRSFGTPTESRVVFTLGQLPGCFRGSYFQLPKQFESAGLSQYVNFWHQIHDFTKSSEGLNYSLTAEPPTWLPEFFERKPKDVAHVQVDLDPAGATVPLTAGPTGSSAGDTPTLALAFAKKQAKDLFVTILEQGAGATLVSTNEVKLRESEIDRLFATSENEQYKQVEFSNSCCSDRPFFFPS